ncbi:HD domain-containing protein, partial [bacterium]|nr:HD domain-containing protein [bacterium]
LYTGIPFWKIWLTNRSWNIYFAFLEVVLGVLYVVTYYVGGILLFILGFSFLAVLRWGYLLHLEKVKILNLFMELLHEQLEKLDLPTKQHCEVVGILAEAVGKRMGVPFWRREQLVYAARLHDVGKIAVDERIIESTGPLTPQQREEIRRHTSVPYHAMRDVPYLKQVGYWIFLHHEKMDGSGYWGRVGDEIPLEARILGVVDAIHALTSPRPYRGNRPAYKFDEAIEILYEEARRGKWDVKVLEIMKEIVQNDERFRDMLNAG